MRVLGDATIAAVAQTCSELGVLAFAADAGLGLRRATGFARYSSTIVQTSRRRSVMLRGEEGQSATRPGPRDVPLTAAVARRRTQEG